MRMSRGGWITCRVWNECLYMEAVELELGQGRSMMDM